MTKEEKSKLKQNLLKWIKDNFSNTRTLNYIEIAEKYKQYNGFEPNSDEAEFLSWLLENYNITEK